MIYDIIIVGAGPAGMTAALYALRSGKSVLILEAETFGGQIANSPRLENYPSIKSISGNEFANNLLEQIIDLGVAFELEKVINIKKVISEFIVTTEDNEYISKAVIIATGVKHKTLGIYNEENLVGNGVSYCAVCDGAFFKNEEVAVIGDANSAVQYAIQLSNYCSKIYLCALFDRLFADQILINRLNQISNISIVYDVSLKEMIADENNNLCQLMFENTKTSKPTILNVKGCFIAIGQVPHNEEFKNIVELDEQGYIIGCENTITKTPGLFVAGDCRTKKIRQVTTAVADGATAGIAAANYLDSFEN